MKSASDFIPLLGPPIRPNEEPDVLEIGRSWGVSFPEDFCNFMGSYGDSVISEFIFLCGMRKLESYSAGMGRKLEKSDSVPVTVLPSCDGALLWGNTIEGDQLFLVRRATGQWTVSAFRRQWGDWYESDIEFSDWLYSVLTGSEGTEWLPDWGNAPYPIRPVR